MKRLVKIFLAVALATAPVAAQQTAAAAHGAHGDPAMPPAPIATPPPGQAQPRRRRRRSGPRPGPRRGATATTPPAMPADQPHRLGKAKTNRGPSRRRAGRT